jgi:hypothetical protein
VEMKINPSGRAKASYCVHLSVNLSYSSEVRAVLL